MKFLAIETSTEACSCALAVDSQRVFRHVVAPRQHADRILAMVDELMTESHLSYAELDGLGFGRGPGSFTGVRIAASVAQGLAFGADLPVVPVSTLKTLAYGVARKRRAGAVAVALDARMSQVYWGCFRLLGEHMVVCGEEGVYAPDAVPVPPGDTEWIGCGSGFKTYPDALLTRLHNVAPPLLGEALPHALDVCTLGLEGLRQGKAVAASDALPVYIRDQVTYRKP